MAKTKLGELEQLWRKISGALKSTIDAHGPITELLITSTTKRIVGSINAPEEQAEIMHELAEIDELRHALDARDERIRELEQDCEQSAIAMNAENDRHIARIVELESQVLIAHGTIRMAVDRLGGTVEDRPTHEGNFLQRVDELRRLEQQLKAAQSEVEHWKSVSKDCSDNYHAMRSEIEAAADTSRKFRAAQERLAEAEGLLRNIYSSGNLHSHMNAMREYFSKHANPEGRQS